MLKSLPSIISTIKETINTTTAHSAFSNSTNNNSIIIDVREPAEVAQNTIQGAINIPRGVLEKKALELYPNAEQPIYIHCASGVRAVFAAEQLQRLGYKNITAITCPIQDVQAAALAVN